MVGKRSSPKGKKASAGPAKAPRKQPALDRREEFIRLYLIHKNKARAYREAGFDTSPHTDRQNAHHLFTSHYVQERLAEEREKTLATLDVKVEDVLDRFKAIAFGDAAAITEYVVGACRYCHGVDHHYQWRHQDELTEATEEAIRESDRSGKPARFPDPHGGIGYRASAPPHPECPNCDGDGIARVRFKDTRLMTPDERKLFAGVKQTQHGIEFKLNDQVAALKELAEHVQFYKARDDHNANALARAIAEIQDRGAMGRMPLRKDQPEGKT